MIYNENSQILNGIFEVVWISTPEFKMASILKLKKIVRLLIHNVF